MLADIVKIHCLKHHAAFPMPRTSRVVVCKEGGDEHTLSDNFPYSGSWIYCCNCQTFIAWEIGKELARRRAGSAAESEVSAPAA